MSFRPKGSIKKKKDHLDCGYHVALLSCAIPDGAYGTREDVWIGYFGLGWESIVI